MNAIEYLIQEHVEHRELLELVSLDRTLFPKLRFELIHHINVEETIFYPNLLKVPELEMIVREAWEEHSLFMQLLQEMDELDLSSKVWESKFLTLKKLILIHLDDEERDLFPKVNRYASKDFLNELGEQMLYQKVLTPTQEIIYPEEQGSHKLQQ